MANHDKHMRIEELENKVKILTFSNDNKDREIRNYSNSYNLILEKNYTLKRNLDKLKRQDEKILFN